MFVWDKTPGTLLKEDRDYLFAILLHLCTPAGAAKAADAAVDENRAIQVRKVLT